MCSHCRRCWVATEICVFVLWIFFVRGMQVNFCNVVYVCKICEEKFGNCWWSFSWLGQSILVVWHPHCVSDRQFQWIHSSTVSVLVDSKGNKKTAHWYCLSLYYCYNRMRNGVAYCCRDFIVNRHKAHLTNPFTILCYDSWTSSQH